LWKQNDLDMLERYEVHLKNNKASVEMAIDVLVKSKENIVLLCWCNPERNGKEVYCHRTVLGKWIDKHFGGKYEVIISDMGGKIGKKK